MHLKKFLVIPVLLMVYLQFWSLVLPFIPSQETRGPPERLEHYVPRTLYKGGAYSMERITLGEAVSVSVSRPYFWGMLEMPIYVNEKSVGWMHDSFFTFITVLTLVFVVVEVYQYRKDSKWFSEYEKLSGEDWFSSSEKGGEKTMGFWNTLSDVLKRYGKATLWGILVAILAGIFSGSANAIVLGFLVIYLESRLPILLKKGQRSSGSRKEFRPKEEDFEK